MGFARRFEKRDGLLEMGARCIGPGTVERHKPGSFVQVSLDQRVIRKPDRPLVGVLRFRARA